LNYDLTPGMLAAAATVVVAGYLIARRHLSRTASLSIAVVKAAIPLLYFARFFEGQWFMLDDYLFQQQGEVLLGWGYTPWTVLTTPYGWDLLNGLTDGQWLYPWWNMLAQWLYGPGYWAPVFLNVVLTFVTGYFTARTLEDLGFSPRYVRFWLVFFLLHVELLAWSSILNMKDFVVLAMGSISLWCVVAVAKLYRERSSDRRRPYVRKTAVYILIFAALWLPFKSIRFYVPVLVLLALAAWGFLSLRWRWRIAILASIPFAYRWALRAYAPFIEYLQPAGLAFGLLRFPLTPRPWSIQPNYTFLFVPSIVQWILFIPAVMAAATLWSRNALARIPILYLLITIVFFAVVPEVQGPRHRVQVLPLIAWLEFHAIWLALASTSRRVQGSPAVVAAPA
jgi:hypothetical protein